MTEIISIACPPRCDAGNSQWNGGHIFDINRDFIQCDECGGEYSIPAGSFHDTRQLRKVACKLCEFIGALTSNGGSLYCRCGLSAFDWSMMRGD